MSGLEGVMSTNFPNFEREETLRDKLAEAFDSAEVITLKSGESVRVVDIAPPDELLKTKIPTLFIAGFASPAIAAKDAIVTMAAEGRRVLCVDTTHGVTADQDLDTELPNAEARKLTAILSVLEAKGVSNVNVVASSEGAIAATEAACLFPERFYTLVLANPAGLYEDDSMIGLVRRSIATKGEEIKEQSILRAQREGKYDQSVSLGVEIPEDLRNRRQNMNSLEVAAEEGTLEGLSKLRETPEYIVGNEANVETFFGSPLNFLRTIEEIRAIARSDITVNLKTLRGLGIPVSVVAGVDDKLFPMSQMQNKLVDEDGISLVKGFYSVSGGHNAIYLEEPYGILCEEATTQLQIAKAVKQKSPISVKLVDAGSGEYLIKRTGYVRSGNEYVPGISDT